jgi:hypothetical protein
MAEAKLSVFTNFRFNIALPENLFYKGAECSAEYCWTLQLIELALHLCNVDIRTLNLGLLDIHVCGSTATTCWHRLTLQIQQLNILHGMPVTC